MAHLLLGGGAEIAPVHIRVHLFTSDSASALALNCRRKADGNRPVSVTPVSEIGWVCSDGSRKRSLASALKLVKVVRQLHAAIISESLIVVNSAARFA